MSTKMYEDITPGSLIRIEFEQPLRGITISAFEVAVLNVTRDEDNPTILVSIKLGPFAKEYGELRFFETTQRWTFHTNKRSLNIEFVPVSKVTLLD